MKHDINEVIREIKHLPPQARRRAEKELGIAKLQNEHKVFVYGTLLTGECNAYRAGDARRTPAWTRGKIFDTGYGFPAFVKESEAEYRSEHAPCGLQAESYVHDPFFFFYFITREIILQQKIRILYPLLSPRLSLTFLFFLFILKKDLTLHQTVMIRFLRKEAKIDDHQRICHPLQLHHPDPALLRPDWTVNAHPGRSMDRLPLLRPEASH